MFFLLFFISLSIPGSKGCAHHLSEDHWQSEEPGGLQGLPGRLSLTTSSSRCGGHGLGSMEGQERFPASQQPANLSSLPLVHW